LRDPPTTWAVTNYFVCFTFGMMAGATVVIAMVLVLLKEKARRHGP